MIVVLNIICIISIVYIIFLFLISSNIILKIKDCNIFYDEKYQKKIEIRKIKTSIEVYVFKKIRILNIKIHENYCEIFKIKVNLNLLKILKEDEQTGTTFVIKNILKLKPKIKNIYFKLNLGTENLMFTTFLIPTISTGLSIILGKYGEKKENINSNNNLEFKINPIYVNKNMFELNTSIEISFSTIRTLFFIRKHKKIKE